MTVQQWTNINRVWLASRSPELLLAGWWAARTVRDGVAMVAIETWALHHGLCLFMPRDLTDLPVEACPGCGCMPGDGRTESCAHPDGCGYHQPRQER
jgi:hypothetical protein